MTTPAGALAGVELDPALRARLEALIEEGKEIWERFDLEVRQKNAHPFVAADYDVVLRGLLPFRGPGLRFLEWGSATGVIAVMADMLGFESYGIEMDPALVGTARDLAGRHGSAARFEAGSFLPLGYRFRQADGRPTHVRGAEDSAYPALGHPLDDFDLVYGFPWPGEEPMYRDLMRCYGGRDARLLLYSVEEGVTVSGGPARRR